MDRVELREYAQHEFLDCKEAEILAKALLREMDAHDALKAKAQALRDAVANLRSHTCYACDEGYEDEDCTCWTWEEKAKAVDRALRAFDQEV